MGEIGVLSNFGVSLPGGFNERIVMFIQVFSIALCVTVAVLSSVYI